MSVPFNRAANGTRKAFLEALRAGVADQPCIYFVGWKDGPIKIGFARSLERRWQEIQIACPYPVFVWAAVPGNQNDESRYHRQFHDLRIRGEWFERNERLLTEIDRLAKGSRVSHLQVIK